MSFRPVKVCEVELSEPVSAITAPGHESALVLARWYSEPLAVVDIPLRDGTADAGQVAQALWLSVGQQVKARCSAAGDAASGTAPPVLAAARPAGARPVAPPPPPRRRRLDGPQALRDSGLRLPWPPQYLLGRAATLRNAPPASVIICTRDRAERLGSCLTAVLRQDYPDFEVIVVDNAPADDGVARPGGPAAARPGRAASRCGTSSSSAPACPGRATPGCAAASGRIVAYLDDDEHPDRHWLAELARGFTLGRGVAGVSGLVLPAVLDTPAQRPVRAVRRAQQGPRPDARGLRRRLARPPAPAVPAARRSASARPWPSTGRRCCGSAGSTWRSGAGTPARAGEDTAAIADLMLDGGTFVYWPGAVMWHEHRKEFAEVERQLDGYGSGLTAFYTRAVLRDPRRLLTLARLAPGALRDLRGKDSVRTATMTGDYPAALRRASVRGMLSGPFRYLRSRRVQARVARVSAHAARS